MKCRACGSDKTVEFLDLGFSPPSNSFLKAEDFHLGEVSYPLKTFFCENCYFVQLDEYKSHKEIFSGEYVYFSSYSKSWLKHAEEYVSNVVDFLDLTPSSFVVEIASNDGYLLQNFVARNIPCLGVEPTGSTAAVSRSKGIPTEERFFGKQYAEELCEVHGKPNLIIGNNVLAHVPDIRDFIFGVKVALAKNGTTTFEFPHLLNLLNEKQFDTIYHEHFSYLSLIALEPLFKQFELEVYKVDKLTTHGGSLRLYIGHQGDHSIQYSVEHVKAEELQGGLSRLDTYLKFGREVPQIKLDFLLWLLNKKKQGRRIAAFGAAAKGNTFLNYCGVDTDLIDYVVDSSPYKQGLFLPGSHIPVVGLEYFKKHAPDDLIVLPWNLKEEIASLVAKTIDKKINLVVAIPKIVES